MVGTVCVVVLEILLVSVFKKAHIFDHKNLYSLGYFTISIQRNGKALRFNTLITSKFIIWSGL